MWRADVLQAVESVSSLPDREGHSQLRQPIALSGGFGAAAPNEPCALYLIQDQQRFGRTPSRFIASAAASVCMAVWKAAMSGISAMSPTRCVGPPCR